MAAGESAVNRASMAQAAQQVEAAVTVITGLQANMNSYTSQLGGGWQGNAAVAFTRTYEMFSADFAKVLSSLQVIQENLVSTRNTYQATEDANTARVNQVAGMINGSATLGGAAVKGGGADVASNKLPPPPPPPAGTSAGTMPTLNPAVDLGPVNSGSAVQSAVGGFGGAGGFGFGGELGALA